VVVYKEKHLFSHKEPRYTGDMSVGRSGQILDSFKILMRLLAVALFTVFALGMHPANAQDAPPEATSAAPATAAINGSAIKTSGLPLPRFVSLKSDKVYVRTGPSVRYPIRWIYQKADLPVEIVEEFDTWRKIRDSQGEGGWVSQTLLSGERTALVKGADLAPVREDPAAESRMLARFESGVIANIDQCEAAWCRVSAGGYKGWIERNSLWGIYENEELN
jgi:SH3-like domain-containing protein